jgi:acetyl-CoA C-acetyltransferase
LKTVPALDPAEVADVYLGCANQAGEDNRNVARMAVLLAGLPQSVPGCTVNRLCASGLEAIDCAARAILAGEGEVYVAGGVESMSRAPWVLPKAEKAFPFGNLTAYDTALGWRFPNPRLEKLFPLQSMGETAENIAEKFQITRADQDAFALESHRRACRARDQVFAEEIVPVPAPTTKDPKAAALQDETMRADTTLEKLAALKPAFRKGGSVTAGNSSSMNDGAAAVLLMEASRAKALGVKPLARWAGSAAAGVDPALMGLGPVDAVRRLLGRKGLKTADIDLFEVNEAFAAQALACARLLELDSARLNVNGGAIALGHPLGSSGARITVTLLHEMRRRGSRRAVASLCIGVGQGLAAVWEAA